MLSLAAVLMIAVGFLFTRMGGEFVPTLDEGDFVIQPVLKTGTSLKILYLLPPELRKF